MKKPKAVVPIIVSDLSRKWGEPIFVGTRLTLIFIISLLTTRTAKEVLAEYPYLEPHKALLIEMRAAVRCAESRKP